MLHHNEIVSRYGTAEQITRQKPIFCCNKNQAIRLVLFRNYEKYDSRISPPFKVSMDVRAKERHTLLTYAPSYSKI